MSARATRMKQSRKKSRSSSQKQDAAKASILIIDSDPLMSALLQEYLEQAKGYNVTATETGSEGIRLAIEEVPDLVLLDFRLSDMGGLEAHEMLQQNPATKNVSVVYISPFPTLRRIEQATSKGAKGFITKPFSPSKICAKVASVLRTM